MKVATLVSIGIAAITVACAKAEPASTTTTTSASSAVSSAQQPCDAFQAKMLASRPSVKPGEKETVAKMCEAISPQARSCYVAAKDKAAEEACITGTEKENMIAAALGAMGDAKPTAAGAASPTKLDKLGLKLDVAGDATVSDGILKKNSVDVVAMSVGGINVSVAGASSPKTLKAAQADAKLFKPKNVKAETLRDGWALSFENSGSAGTNYWVQVRRDIAKKAYECSAIVDTAEKSAAAVAACKTLRAN